MNHNNFSKRCKEPFAKIVHVMKSGNMRRVYVVGSSGWGNDVVACVLES